VQLVGKTSRNFCLFHEGLLNKDRFECGTLKYRISVLYVLYFILVSRDLISLWVDTYKLLYIYVMHPVADEYHTTR